MREFAENFANLTTVVAVYPLLRDGLLVTLALALICIPLGVLVGLAVAVLHAFRVRALNRLLILYVDFMRAFPPLVLLILIYYGLPFVGVQLREFPAAVLAFTLNSSGYYGEILRAGIESIPKGQTDAARSSGLGALQALGYVVLPQAIRNVIPPLTSNTLELVKGTSVASAVALPELLHTARTAQGLVYNPTPLTVAALTYLVLLWPLVRLLSRFERRMMTPR